MKESQVINPLTHVIDRISTILSDLGFTYVSGPELETEYYNFDALNVPKDHPSRDMQDTFWLKQFSSEENCSPDHFVKQNDLGVKSCRSERKLLRTQTSAVQIRFMEQNNQPPFKIFSPGRVFRQEATDATHEMQFYQWEGLLIDKNVSMADLKSVINTIFDRFFERDINVRFRPSFFPFVEPGAEVDISCFKCVTGVPGCPICKGTGWVEVMGAGMVNPKVLNGMGINPEKWQGYAFGASIERLAMMKYGIDDIRLFYSGDLRLVNQFEVNPDKK
ncbi:MAG: phenylalanine--tRNA ligase subunit alpha [Minisyncoccia bacterium]